MSCHSSGSLEGGCPSSAEVIEDNEDFFQLEGLYSLFSAVERIFELFQKGLMRLHDKLHQDMTSHFRDKTDSNKLRGF